MEYAKRKYPRLKQYDYSLPGYYYVTIHAEQNAALFSRIIPGSVTERPTIQLTAAGLIAQEQLLNLEIRYDYV